MKPPILMQLKLDGLVLQATILVIHLVIIADQLRPVLLLLSLMILGLHQHTFILVLLLITSTPEEGLPDPPRYCCQFLHFVFHTKCVSVNYQATLFSFIRTIISDFIVIFMLINVKHHPLFPCRFLISPSLNLQFSL